ncbi:hypothetical protein FVEN_g12237 [Fusarium venenatum]|uniref:BZIP domain-containing protein n=1 Tax=Fusarium venenatum TaxID=56646 RepID=A0A2L2TB23_9HYPO|nr:uncharacterized protein FVRRES_08239 [Fusarium venenatum]KAG8349542.1 hypothetical protein FVEN_g12237 [Fusarium venenatum]CEI68162.1 unnamed protein product [Fusarium venenatum]
MTPKSKRVTAEHTRNRVRDNQRRHRARRKDYIATLEEKIAEADRTISSLRSQVDDLEETLKRDSNGRTLTTLAAGPECVDIQEAPTDFDIDDLLLPITGLVTEEPKEINDPDRDDLPDMNIELTDLALSILQPAMFPPPSQTGDSLAYQSYQNNNYQKQNQSAIAANTCCSPSFPPVETELSAELTRLCCEAYILIAQQDATVLRDETSDELLFGEG